MINIESIKPIGNQILIELLPKDKESKGGILIPENTIQQGHPVKAKILKVSDKLLFKKEFETNSALSDAMWEEKIILVHLHLGGRTKTQLSPIHFLINKDLVIAIL